MTGVPKNKEGEGSWPLSPLSEFGMFLVSFFDGLMMFGRSLPIFSGCPFDTEQQPSSPANTCPADLLSRGH